MSAFTPGPWSRNISPATKYPTVYAGRNTHVAVVDTRLPPEQVEANCALIAAAPEMHGALEAADVDLDLLLMAIKAGDPARELEIRASDIKRRLSAALSRVKG